MGTRAEIMRLLGIANEEAPIVDLPEPKRRLDQAVILGLRIKCSNCGMVLGGFDLISHKRVSYSLREGRYVRKVEERWIVFRCPYCGTEKLLT